MARRDSAAAPDPGKRNLICTAIPRGRKKVFNVGEPAAYGMAVRNAESKLRCTHLREKILSADSG